MKGIFTSRKFWALLLGLALLFIPLLFPSFVLDEELAIGFLVVIVPYILGVAVDPGVSGWRGVIKSRKFWAAAVGFSVLVLSGFGVVLPVELSPDTLIWFAVLIGGYIGGVAIESKLPQKK